ncbi:hypothetical protein [Rhodococcus jostii]|uniref:Uncharacterized protein n=1 Tax=Rhodococcus jostii TaxID=132919 RepID=A0A1H5MHH3_RHOJO|nr:hypothetical protein [Rhodococcus jostii]SEE88815.1 hypothetical protein SAMN04490220_8999 [Rhodococcus jostii]
MNLFMDTVDSLWQVVLIGLLFGAGLPAIFALGIRFLSPGVTTSADGSATRTPAASIAGLACFAVIVVAIVAGILFIMKDFLAHDFGIYIF